MDAFGSEWRAGPDCDGDQRSQLAPANLQGGLDGELTTWNSPSQLRPRKSQRLQVDLGAGLRQRGASGVSVRVIDLSAHGFRASTHLDLPEGADVWLRLPGLEPSHAKVAWSEGHYIGCAFERPLHPAVVDMIVRKSLAR